MNIKLNFNEQFDSIDVIYPINYSDRLDGLSDTISCEFYLNDDLLPYYHKHQKIVIDILDDENNILKQFRMCATDLNRELCSTYDKNSAYTYRYTLTACEPTVLINENIRTDIAITPYAYGEDSPYKTLWDAYVKVCSCHNLNNRNEPLYNLYRSWYINIGSNYVTADYIPTTTFNFWLTGELKGGNKIKSYYYHQTGKHIKITATLPTYTWNDEIVTLPVEREATITATTERWDDLDPSIIETTTHTYTLNFILDINNENQLYADVTRSTSNDDDFLWDVDFFVEYKEKRASLYSYLSTVPCPSLTYKDLSTYSQLEDLFSRVGLVPYLDFDLSNEKKSYVTFYMLQGEYIDNNYSTIETLSNEETAKLNDYTANTVSSQIKNISCDTETITFPSKYTAILKGNNYGLDSNGDVFDIPVSLDNTFSVEQLGLYTSNENAARGINMLVPNTYDEGVHAIQDANQYYLELPTNIENIQYIFYIVAPNNSTDQSLALRRINTQRVIEYSMWQNLPASQQKLYAYFVRGENKIRQAVALLASVQQLSGDWSWSDAETYEALRKARFVCVYKPIIDLSYTYYKYNNLEDKTTKNVDFPYKAISDKQISNQLAYEYEKQVSNKISYKLVTRDINEVVNHYAGQRVYYKNRRFNKNDLIKDNDNDYFATLADLQLDGYASVGLNLKYNVYTKNSYAMVGTENDFDYYVINEENNSWEKYIGNPCVITKMDVVINRNSIEVSYEMNTNISQNSVVTGYSDNVRISDNLSTETEVTRDINFYKTFLLNCTASKLDQGETNLSIPFYSVALPPNASLGLHNKNDFFLNGIDNMLLPAGLLQMGCFSYNANYLNDVNKINKLSLIYNYDYGTMIFVPPVSSQAIVAYRQKMKIVNGTTISGGTMYNEYCLHISDGSMHNSKYNIKLKYENGKYIFTNIWTETNNSVTDVTRCFLPTYLLSITDTDKDMMLNDKMYFTYSQVPSSSTYTTVRMVKHYVTNPTEKWYNWQWGTETLPDTWDCRASSYPTYYALCDYSLDSLDETYVYSTNNNPIFVSSNNMSKLSFINTNTCTIGNYVDGFDNKMWTKSLPLFYKQSDGKTELLGLNGVNCNFSGFTAPYNNADIPTYFYENLIKKYGYNDLYIDIREKINMNIQYIVIPNNVNKFYADNVDWLYADQWIMARRYCPYNNTIADIEEINTNIDWLSNILEKSQPEDYNTGSLIFKRIPKNVTMADFIKNKINYPQWCSATGEITSVTWQDDLFGMQRDYHINITTIGSITADSDTYNYVLINKKEDGEEVPLMIINTEGCDFPENKIQLSYFLI